MPLTQLPNSMAPSPGDPPADHAEPSRPRRRPWIAWLALLPLLALAALPMVLNTPGKDVGDVMEKLTLNSSIQTWHAWHDGEDVLLVSVINHRPRLRKPPMTVWVHMLAWTGLDPDTVTADTLIHRARCASAGLVLLGFVGLYGIGLRLGGMPLAVMSVAIAATQFHLVDQARTAVYDTHLIGWATLAMACGLWAMQRSAHPLRCTWFGWVLCGLMMAAGILTKGPIALVFTALPLLGWLLMPRVASSGDMASRRQRVSRAWAGFGLAMLVAVLASAWWYGYAFLQHQETARIVTTEWAATDEGHSGKPWFSYLMVFGMVVPWTPWLIAGLLMPWIEARGVARRRLLLGVVWVLLPLVVMSLHPSKKPRYIVPVLPACGLVAAQVWLLHLKFAWRGIRRKQRWHVLAPHLVLLGVGTLGIAFTLLAPGLMFRLLEPVGGTGITDLRIGGAYPGLPLSFGLSVVAVVVCSLAVAVYAAWRNRPMLGVLSAAVWSGTLLLGANTWYALTPPAAALGQDVGLIVRELTLQQPMPSYLLRSDPQGKHDLIRSDADIYAQQPISPISPDDLQRVGRDMLAQDQSFIVLVEQDWSTPPWLARHVARSIPFIGEEDKGVILVIEP